MIRTRIAATAALATFGLAALGAALAGPANADTDTSSAPSASDTSSSAPSASNAATAQPSTSTLRSQVADQTAQVQAKVNQLQANGDESIASTFKQQMLMNRLSQMSEMSASVVSSSNSAIASMARNVKG